MKSSDLVPGQFCHGPNWIFDYVVIRQGRYVRMESRSKVARREYGLVIVLEPIFDLFHQPFALGIKFVNDVKFKTFERMRIDSCRSYSKRPPTVQR